MTKSVLPLVILGLLAACDSGTASPLTSSDVSPSTTISTPTTATPATTVPMGASARRIFQVDDPGHAFRSTDAPCPVLADELVGHLLADQGFPEVQVSYAESGSTIFFHCPLGWTCDEPSDIGDLVSVHRAAALVDRLGHA